MHYLNASYANWFRARYKLVGTVFQGRYKSILVDEDSYALVLSAYILKSIKGRGLFADWAKLYGPVLVFKALWKKKALKGL